MALVHIRGCLKNHNPTGTWDIEEMGHFAVASAKDVRVRNLDTNRMTECRRRQSSNIKGDGSLRFRLILYIDTVVQ